MKIRIEYSGQVPGVTVKRLVSLCSILALLLIAASTLAAPRGDDEYKATELVTWDMLQNNPSQVDSLVVSAKNKARAGACAACRQEAGENARCLIVDENEIDEQPGYALTAARFTASASSTKNSGTSDCPSTGQ